MRVSYYIIVNKFRKVVDEVYAQGEINYLDDIDDDLLPRMFDIFITSSWNVDVEGSQTVVETLHDIDFPIVLNQQIRLRVEHIDDLVAHPLIPVIINT